MSKLTAEKMYFKFTDTNRMVVCLEVIPNKDNLKAYDSIKNLGECEIDADITKHREHRSNNANAKMWVLLDAISEKLDNGTSREELYRDYVRKFGVFDFVNITDKAVDTFIKGWNNQGLGWYAEIVRDSKNEGSKVIVVYYGSSIYDSKQMYKLLSAVVHDADELGIPTMSPEEMKRLCGMQGSDE